jgi:hypothetical protein
LGPQQRFRPLQWEDIYRYTEYDTSVTAAARAKPLEH